VQNVRVSTVRLTALCATLALLAGCAWDGPEVAVRVVPPPSTIAPTAVEGAVGAAVDDGRTAGAGNGDADTVVAEPRGREAAPTDVVVEPVGGAASGGARSSPSTVAVVGDSLTVSAEQEILAALTADGLDVLAVDGLESRRMTHGGTALPPGTSAIEDIQRLVTPDLWVIALGTNDVASVGSADGFRAEMRELLELLPDDAPVVWVDLWIRDRETAISEANRLIRAELRTRRGGAAVVDWFSHGTEDGVITGDGVHLTDAGRQLFASSIAAAIDELFAD
jgi:lysophospholipase L1-like esterase